MSLTEDLKNNNSYLTTTQVVALLQIRRNKVCAWVKQGILPAIRVGQGYRFDPHELAAWMETRHNRPRAIRADG